MVHQKTRSSRWERRCGGGSEGVPCSFLGYDQERRSGTLDKCSDDNGVYCGSSCGSGDRPPSIVYESLGEAHRLGSGPDQGSLRGMGGRRYGDWSGVWGFPS